MSKRPNIVLMMADDMGYGDFGAFNNGFVRTPNLDQLINEGTCLSQHYAGSPICSPSRASFLTGRYPQRTGAVTFAELRGLDRFSLREVTIADNFQAAGYCTGMVGKWHNGAIDPQYHPNARGFSEFVGFRGGWADYYNWNLDVNGSIRPGDGRYLTDVLTEEAIFFMKRHANDPFFLTVTFNAPHAPMQAPEYLIDAYMAMGLNRGIAITYAMIESMDIGVGRIVQALDDLSLSDNTIIMFTSDNGPDFKLRPDVVPEGMDASDFIRFNCGFRGAKTSVYEGGIRLPMIMRWPDGLPEGARELNDFVHFVDWLPTLLGAANISKLDGPPIDGINILPALRGEAPWVEPHRFWQWSEMPPSVTTNASMRDGDWKLVRPRLAFRFATPLDEEYANRYVAADHDAKYNPERYTSLMQDPDPEVIRDDPPEPELYNIASDYGENTNLASEYPERTRVMLRELETWFEEVNAERITAQQETLSR